MTTLEYQSPGYVKYKNLFLNKFNPSFNCTNIIAISNCYANHKTLGVYYSNDIMKLIYDFDNDYSLNNSKHTSTVTKTVDEVENKTCEFYRTPKYSYAQSRVNFKFINFIKSSNNLLLSKINNNDEIKTEEKPLNIQEPDIQYPYIQLQNSEKLLSFNEATKSEHHNENLEKFRNVYIQIKIVEASLSSPKKIIMAVAEKSKQNIQYEFETVENNEISCNIILNQKVIVGKSIHINKKLAKIDAMKNLHINFVQGIDISKYIPEVPLGCPPEVPLGCPPEVDSDLEIELPIGAEIYDLPILKDFYLRNNRMVTNATGILQESFQLFKLQMNFSEIDDRIHLVVEGNSLASIDFCSDNATTKSRLSQFVLRHLQKSKWTLMRNTLFINENTDSVNIDKSGMYQTNLQDPTRISTNSNIGGKLMLKMGWNEECGLGRTGDGIKEPIINEMNDKRKGLGFDLGSSANLKSFCNNVTKALKEWIEIQDDDLIFDRQFDNKERAIIHKQCRKLGLLSKSYNNTTGDRFLVVTYNRDPHGLFQWVKSKGGKTKLYTLMPPGSWMSDL